MPLVGNSNGPRHACNRESPRPDWTPPFATQFPHLYGSYTPVIRQRGELLRKRAFLSFGFSLPSTLCTKVVSSEIWCGQFGCHLHVTSAMALVSALQIPYREARDGFWGEQTSTLNWCEEVNNSTPRKLLQIICLPAQDYNITFYCAEVVNTVTNLIFMWLGFKGLRNVIKYSHDRVFILAFLGYIVVGLGSMAFHATLKCLSDQPFCPPEAEGFHV